MRLHHFAVWNFRKWPWRLTYINWPCYLNAVFWKQYINISWYHYCIYLNNAQLMDHKKIRVLCNLSSEKWGVGEGSPCTQSLTKHVLCRCFPENWRLWRRVILYLSTYDNCVIRFVVLTVLIYLSRWSELTRKIELWVEIQELNEQGEYSPVEVITKPDILTGGIYQLRQGQQRRIQVRVKPVQNSGTLPIICQSIVSIAIGSVSVMWVWTVND